MVAKSPKCGSDSADADYLAAFVPPATSNIPLTTTGVAVLIGVNRWNAGTEVEGHVLQRCAPDSWSGGRSE